MTGAYTVTATEISRKDAMQLPSGTQVLLYNPFCAHASIETIHPKHAIYGTGNKLWDKFSYYILTFAPAPDKQ